jgi:hypothetical protein
MWRRVIWQEFTDIPSFIFLVRLFGMFPKWNSKANQYLLLDLGVSVW